MNEIIEEWKEDDGGIKLSLPLARKYMEAETHFLCRIPSFNIVGASKITHISPNGLYAQISFYSNSYWVKISDLKVVDVLTAITKEKKPADVTVEEVDKVLEAYKKLQKKYPEKGKK